MEINLDLHKDVVVEKEVDRVGTGKFTLDTGIYEFTIKQMYPVKNTGGSYSMQLVLETPDKKTFNPCIYYMDASGDVTTISNYGATKGKRVFTIGYNQLESICQLAIGKSLVEVAKSKQSKVVVKQFTKDEKVTVDMYMDIIGSKIQMAIEERRVNKQVNSGQLNAKGKPLYVNTSEDRLINEFVKVYNEAGFTSQELEAGKTTTDHKNLWSEKNAGKLVDKYVTVTSGITAGIPKQTSASAF